MFVLGWEGMPRRYYDYLPKFNGPNLVSTIGSWVLALGLIIMFYNLIHSLFAGKEAGDNPWEAASLGIWRTSPPPTENFEKIPVVTKGPYEFK